jgi:hypothetical protein
MKTTYYLVGQYGVYGPYTREDAAVARAAEQRHTLRTSTLCSRGALSREQMLRAAPPSEHRQYE